MVVAVFAHLHAVFELAFEQVCVAAFAFDEDVFSLHHTLFRRHRFNSFGFLIEPGHKNAGKGSTKNRGLKLDTLLRADSRGKWMFNFLRSEEQTSELQS